MTRPDPAAPLDRDQTAADPPVRGTSRSVAPQSTERLDKAETVSAAAHALPPSLQTGLQVGHYILQAPLGAGGMGVVWRARDTQLDRDVALKFLPEFAHGADDALARFAREAQAVARLRHPGIVTLYDASIPTAPNARSGAARIRFACGRRSSGWPKSPRRWHTRTPRASFIAT